MTAELDALLEAIRENPEDDLPRLALADWCQEQPQEAERARGEFIQLRCRAAALPLGHTERGKMEARANELKAGFERDWLGGLVRLLPGWDFERGCVLILVRENESLRLDRRVPEWKWVIGLRGVMLSQRACGLLLGSAMLAGLASISLRDCELGRNGANSLARNESLSRLAALHLDYCGLGDEGATSLSATWHFRRLTVLTLANNNVHHLGCSMLAKAEGYHRLAHLDLSRNSVGIGGVRALASTNLAALQDLALSGCDLTDQAGAELLHSSRLQRLRSLDLRDNRFTSRMIDVIREQFGDRVRL